ncbi:MAG: hypothetical protein RR828_08150, partial [Oscillospiraceae bacterium]
MADLAGITRRLAAGGFLSHAYILSGDDPAARQDAAQPGAGPGRPDAAAWRTGSATGDGAGTFRTRPAARP